MTGGGRDVMEWEKKEDARGRKGLGAPEAGEKKGALSLSFLVFFRSGPSPHFAWNVRVRLVTRGLAKDVVD